MTASRLLLSLLLMLSASSRAASDDAKEIRWLGIDLAPMMMLDGPQAGTGYLDEIMNTVRPLFPGYKQSIVYGNSARLEQQMKLGGNTCTVAMLQTPARAKFMVFSKPFARIIPNGVITLKSLEPKFNAFRDSYGNISLTKASADSSLRFGLAQGRVYGGKIDPLIKPLLGPPVAPQVMLLGSTNIGEGLYRMLQRGRVDYMLGYPLEEQYFLQRYADVKSATVFLPVAEAGPLIDRHFACAKSPWGEQRVAEMNRHLESKELRQKLQSIYESHLSSDARSLYRFWLERK